MAKAIYKFYVDYGRNGNVEGIFIAEKCEVEELYGKEVYFGEILGKHSEVSITCAPEQFTVLSEDPDFVSKCVETLGEGTVSGNNPITRWADQKTEAEQAA